MTVSRSFGWFVAIGLLLGLGSSTPLAKASCVGDCNSDGKVAVNELLTMVDLALGVKGATACVAGDSNGDGRISVDEIIRAVNDALNGCSASAVIHGAIKCPTSASLPGCQTRVVPVTVLDFGLAGAGQLQRRPNAQSAPKFQLNVIESFTTDIQGEYDTGDLTESLGDRTQPVIVLADVTSIATIGGVGSLSPGTGLQKELNATTQVGCVAAVSLVLGTDSAGITNAGCTVSATCGAASGCLATIDPETLDTQRISRLERAASFISGEVVFPDDQGPAVCAVLTCTNGGATDATSLCVTSTFRSNR